jgi:methylthioribose-1-phosphate isomerase
MVNAVQGQSVRTVWWEEQLSPAEVVGDYTKQKSVASILLLDQSRLPLQCIYLTLKHEQAVAEAITSLKVRGAPVLGVTAAYGVALAARRFLDEQSVDTESAQLAALRSHLFATAQLLRSTRPTAVNLFWAIQRMLSCAERYFAVASSPAELVAALRQEAQRIADEDVAACLRMGRYGAELIADGDTVLTHCNAGALATTGLGSALAPIYTAHRDGKQIHVFVDETRPVLQGARLTAWELQQAGVPLTLITDNMAGYFMRAGSIKAVFVGADRIAANGDVANKIGTYSVAVLAHVHHIPVYVVAPCSTVDLSLPSGESIPIEQRKIEEVTQIGNIQIAPAGIRVANPAFDVTPCEYISAIITENGIARPPYNISLQDLIVER